MTEVGQILQAFGDNFSHKVTDDYAITVEFDIQPDQYWHVVVEPGKRVTLAEGGCAGAQVVLITTEQTLQQIYAGHMSGLTAAGKAHMSDPAPLDYRLGEGVAFTPELYADMLVFLQRFFNCSDPERILLGEEHSRLVHGGHAIPLYYHPGFRSAWYLVKKGERLNEPGDTDPFPQAFVLIAGEGMAKIGDQTVPVRAGEAYYIPPGADHVVWTENDEPLELIYLAWGKGA